MSTRKKVYGFLLALAAAAALTVVGVEYIDPGGEAWADSAGNQAAVAEDKSDEVAEEVTPVELAPVEAGEISSFISSTANLRAAREVDVVNRSDGRVEDVLVEEGQWVEEGRLLAKFDDTQLRIRLETARKQMAQAQLQMERAAIRKEKAETQIENTREEFQRYKQLYDEQLVSEREVAQLQYQIEELEHDIRISSTDISELRHKVAELGSEIRRSKLEIERTEVRAPFAGLITERMVEPGQTLSNLQPLFKLADFTPLYADVFLSEREAMKVGGGQPASVVLGASDDHRAQGSVQRVAPVVDGSTGTVKVTVRVPRPDTNFKPGAFVRVDIKTDTRQEALMVPKRAVLEEDGGEYLFVVGADNIAHRVEVTTGYRMDGRVEILSGLREGQKVVVAGQGALKEDAKVKVVQ